MLMFIIIMTKIGKNRSSWIKENTKVEDILITS